MVGSRLGFLVWRLGCVNKDFFKLIDVDIIVYFLVVDLGFIVVG